MEKKFKFIVFGFLLLVVGAGLLISFRISNERAVLMDDLHRRARVIAKSLESQAIRIIQNPPTPDEEDVAERFSGSGRTMGILLCGLDGKTIARSVALVDLKSCEDAGIQEAVLSQMEQITLLKEGGETLHTFISPLKNKEGKFVGVLAIVHEASYINERIRSAITWMTFILAILAILISALTYVFSRHSFQRSVNQVLYWMKSSRKTDESEFLPPPTASLLKPVTREVEKLTARLRSARETAKEVSEAQRVSDIWTSAKLKSHAISHFGERNLIVVSNREPYMHVKKQGAREVITPAGGVVTALDPMLRATSGLWIAHGAGDADREFTDNENKILVPPKAPLYSLKRVWLTKEDEEGYYYGFSNEALWPLCHLTHHRPHFEESDWAAYVKVNNIFAEETCKEFGKEQPFVLVQDYHFTLLPKMIREKRPDAVLGLFWHIPWPTTEIFQVCPWKREILEGMLGANFIGFHLQSYCNNFLETVNSLLPVRIDWDRFAVIHEKGVTFVKPFPISIEPWNEKYVFTEEEFAKKISQIRSECDLKQARLVVSVDRLDYTKGIPERLGAIDRFFEKYPTYKEKVSFVQLASPSRIHIPRYRDLVKEVEEKADEVNWKHGTPGWKPVVFLKAHHDSQTVYTYLRMADACIVSSLADGMNLVAKEFVAAREKNDGVLMLSEFAGVAREFPDALQFNPYARADFAEVIHIALEMPDEEQKRRMTRMKARVAENNIYKWAADLISEMANSADLSLVVQHEKTYDTQSKEVS